MTDIKAVYKNKSFLVYTTYDKRFIMRDAGPTLDKKSNCWKMPFTIDSQGLLTNLGASDNRVNSLEPFIHVYGVVWNVGTISAFNCKIHVIGKQGDVVAVDTYIDLQTIPGYEPDEFASFKEIDEQVYYTGPALTEKSITIEYD